MKEAPQKRWQNAVTIAHSRENHKKSNFGIQRLNARWTSNQEQRTDSVTNSSRVKARNKRSNGGNARVKKQKKQLTVYHIYNIHPTKGTKKKLCHYFAGISPCTQLVSRNYKILLQVNLTLTPLIYIHNFCLVNSTWEFRAHPGSTATNDWNSGISQLTVQAPPSPTPFLLSHCIILRLTWPAIPW